MLASAFENGLSVNALLKRGRGEGGGRREDWREKSNGSEYRAEIFKTGWI